MSSMGDLVGGERREEYGEFVERYEKGAPPYDDIPDEEVVDRYHEVAHELSEEDYQEAAREAFSRMSPEERVELGRELRDQAAQRGLDFPGREDAEESFDDADLMARVAARANREHPDLLEDLLKDGGAGLVGGAIGDGVTGGAGASGGEGGMASNPAVKAALAGIVASAVKKAMEGA